MKAGIGFVTATAAALTLTASIDSARAQDNCSTSRLMVVLDKSSSMNGLIGDASKWELAAGALDEVANAYEAKIEMGLDVFPAAGQCSPGEVVVDPAFNSRTNFADALAEPPPSAGNWTPMAQTLDAIADYPMLNDPNASPYVVLITDGWQWCDPYDPNTRFTPVDSVQRLAAAGITTYVVGFGDGVDVETMNRMAIAAGTERAGCDVNAPGTGAEACYYQADNAAELVASLMDVASRIPEDEICDGLDNDCDGEIDEDLVMGCSSACGEGVSLCQAGQWTACDARQPAAEICGDGEDNDCNGVTDDAEICEQGPTEVADPAGCGCQSSSGNGLAGFALLGLFALVGFRRRRRARA